MSDAGLAHLKGLKRLSELGIARTQVTDAGLVHLDGLTNLSELSLSDTAVSGAGLAHLKGLTHLSKLDLGESKVSDAGLARLAALTSLTTLDLQRTGLYPIPVPLGWKMIDGSLRELDLPRIPGEPPSRIGPTQGFRQALASYAVALNQR